ncbi:MAG: molybdate ABC transporter permease subunit [Anaerolineales bacterium]|nr:molybdate ABC transporter permease subunit [Anaerolineales bacterium]
MWQPMLLSLRIAGLSAVIALIIGVFVATVITRWRNPLTTFFDAAVNLPLVLPPTVLGYYLLVTFGARSPIGEWLDQIGLPLVFTWRGAVVAASFVAIPLVVQSTKAAIETVDPNLSDVARTLGRSEWAIFFTVTLPLARHGVLAGAMLAFARALGEFGATLLVAGNIPGSTQTLPLAIYDSVQSGDYQRANLLALALTVTAILLLILIRRLGYTLIGSTHHE